LGQVDWTSAAYYDSTNTAPGTDLGVPQGQIPAVTQHLYDGAGRETAQVFKALGVEMWRTTTSYGGDRQTIVPPRGGTATTALIDVRDRTTTLRQYKNPASAGGDDPATFDATRYTYDLRGSLTRLTDPAGNEWRYTFDLRGRQTVAVDPDKGTVRSTYDAAGNLVTSTDALGAVLAFTYDALGRKTTVREGSVTGVIRAEWVYDTLPNGKGKQTRSVRHQRVGTTTERYETRVNAYDTAGRPTSTSLVVPSTLGALCASVSTAPCEYRTDVTYKNNGATATATLPKAADLASEKLTFGYNDIGEQTGVLSASQIYVGDAIYNKLGQLTKLQFGAYGKRVDVLSTYDEPTRRLTARNVVPELKAEAANYGYQYDQAGNLIRIADAPAGQAADTQCFTVDYLRRLTQAWTPASGNCATAPSVAGLQTGGAGYWHAWTHDAIGNRTKETRYAAAGNTTFTYTHPASGASSVRPHAVQSVAMAAPGQSWTRGFTYDNAGNLKTRVSDAGNQQTLTWDREGRIDTLVEASKTTSFVYDADGNRLVRKDAAKTVLYLPGGTEVSLATGTSTAKATRYYSHKDTVIAVRSATGLSWIIGDHHGTAELSINAADLVVSKRRSLPFGQPRGANPAGWPAVMDKGFVGGTKDPTGLVHLGARLYDAAIGRFISVDPVIDTSDPQQLNAYAYGNNNPVSTADPTGELFGWVKKAASAVASAATTAGNFVANTVVSTVEAIREDPLKFAVGLAVGIAVAVAVAAVCATGAGAEYGVDVAQGDREFSAGDLGKEMAMGAAVGGVTVGAGAALGAAGRHVAAKARGALGKGVKSADEAAEAAGAAARAGRTPAPSNEVVPFYPRNDGFQGDPVDDWLYPGTRIDRYGSERGRYTSPVDTPMPMRALPPGTAGRPYHVYEVVKPIPVRTGKIAPAFGQVGGGVQHILPLAVEKLLARHILRKVQ
ncbi:MAG TPA: glycohydrolase toxin TNT-related protein, partial [Pilimelia sp.]|nr:glycohydrolase toxin TNT-related protein [Pilimelia sp.]